MKIALYIIILIICFQFHLISQTKKLVIQIDTISIPDKTSLIGKFHPIVRNQGFLGLGDSFDTTDIMSYSTPPNYINTIYIKTDSSALDLPIDFNGSVVSLNNIYNFASDTLRINKLIIYNTTPPDTIITRHAYWKSIHGELADKPYKVKHTNKILKPIPPPNDMFLNINGVSYHSALTLAKSKFDKDGSGHGYRPKNYRNSKGQMKRRTRYYHFTTIEKNYIWTGEIKIKNGT